MPTADRYNYYVCPNCGEEVRVGSHGCPHCTRKTKDWEAAEHEDNPGFLGGYSETDDFDYEEFVRREFGKEQPRKPGLISRGGQATDIIRPVLGIMLVLLLVFLLVIGSF